MKHATRALVPVAALALLAGCATPSGGTAFQVNNDKVSLSHVDEVADNCVALAKGQLDKGELKTTVTRMLLAGQIANAVSRSTGTTVTEAERDAEVAKQGGGLEKGTLCSDAITGYINYSLLLEKVGAPKMYDAVKKLDVQVNPRFGGWNADKATFTNDSGSLSREGLGLGKVYGG